jgi:hypothetical protein
MSAFTPNTGAPPLCAFCVKPLPTVNGELQPWRAPSGQFFCNEFCADDAEEARFRATAGQIARPTIWPPAPRPDVRFPFFARSPGGQCSRLHSNSGIIETGGGARVFGDAVGWMAALSRH